MTLRLDNGKGIKIVKLHETVPSGNDSTDLVLLDRQNGLLLNGINFTGDRARKRAINEEGAQIRL
jgi:hypothetical protein